MLNNHSGFSLIEAVIGVGIVTSIAAASATVLTNADRAKTSTLLASDRIAIKQTLMNTVNCTNTLAAYTTPSACTGLLSLLDGGSAAVVAAGLNGTPIGPRWHVRATCSTAGIEVRVAAF